MKFKLNIVLLGILIFLLGGVAGWVSYYLYRDHSKPAAARVVPRDIVEGMARELNLDAGQKEKLRVIFADGRNKFQALNQQFRPLYENVNSQFLPQWGKIRDEIDDQVRKILRPDQKAHFEAFLKKAHSLQRPRLQSNTTKQ